MILYKKIEEQTFNILSELKINTPNKIDVFKGIGSFVNKNTIKISGEKELTIETDKTIIATGSKPSSLPGVDIDKKRIIKFLGKLNQIEIKTTKEVIKETFVD